MTVGGCTGSGSVCMCLKGRRNENQCVCMHLVRVQNWHRRCQYSNKKKVQEQERGIFSVYSFRKVANQQLHRCLHCLLFASDDSACVPARKSSTHRIIRCPSLPPESHENVLLCSWCCSRLVCCFAAQCRAYAVCWVCYALFWLSARKSVCCAGRSLDPRTLSFLLMARRQAPFLRC